MPSMPPGPAAQPPAKGLGQAVIGRSILIKGEVTGQEDLMVEGRIEGRIILPEQHVIVGPTGRVEAEVEAKLVTIEGQVVGNIAAGERVVLTKEGSLTGDIKAARLSVEDGAYLKGSVELLPRDKPKAVSLPRTGAPVQPARPDESPRTEATKVEPKPKVDGLAR